MSKIISARFSSVDVDRLEKLAMSKEMIASEVLREIVTDYFEKQSNNNKFETISADIKALKQVLGAVSDCSMDLIKGFNNLSRVVTSQKQGVTQ